METRDWDILTSICDLSLPELPPPVTSAEEQIQVVHDYLARVRAAALAIGYTYVERTGATSGSGSKAAEESPVLSACHG